MNSKNVTFPHIDVVVKVLHALADEVRLAVIDLLIVHDGTLCQLELVRKMRTSGYPEMSQSNLSHHLKILHEAGLIDFERRHQFRYYHLRPESRPLLQQLSRMQPTSLVVLAGIA